jgi:hypothetical protein
MSARSWPTIFAREDCSIEGIRVESQVDFRNYPQGIKQKEAVMKKLLTAVIVGSLLVFLISCSSTPSGTEKIKDLLKNPEEILGKEVVSVGLAETKTSLSSFRMFKLYDGGDFIWVKFPDTVEEPPQGVKVRVSGNLLEGTFNIIGKVYYIEASKVAME